MAETPAPSTHPKVSKEDRRGTNDSTGIVVMLTTGHNCPQCLVRCQDPAQTVDKQDTGELIALLCRDKVRSISQVPPPQEEGLSDLPGLAAEDPCSPATCAPNEATDTTGAWWVGS